MSLLLSPASYAATNEASIFVALQAFEKGFLSCEIAIQEAFSLVNNNHLRVNAQTFPDHNPTVLSMVGTWGSNGDSMLTKATFVKHKNDCFYDYTAHFTSPNPCHTFTKDKNLKAQTITEAGDFTWVKLDTMNMYLTPAGEGCSVTYSGNRHPNTN